MITKEQYLEAKGVVDAYERRHGNGFMTDRNGIIIKPGNKITYAIGELHESTCDVVQKSDGVYLVNWSDDYEDIHVDDFWYEPTDSKITQVIS